MAHRLALVVDDSKTARVTLQRMLEKLPNRRWTT
jgi:CheY-like chemotaxis protein